MSLPQDSPSPWSLITGANLESYIAIMSEAKKGPVTRKQLVSKVVDYINSSIGNNSMMEYYGRMSGPYSQASLRISSEGGLDEYAKKIVDGVLKSRFVEVSGGKYVPNALGKKEMKRHARLL